MNTDWEAEFYPLTAAYAEGSASKSDRGVLALLDHSLQKWRGLLSVNLKKHNRLADDMPTGGSTCALCVRFRKPSFPYECEGCPLVLVRGVSCFQPRREAISPYEQWTATRDPRPMLRLLLRARCLVERRVCEASEAGDFTLADGRTVGVPQGLLMELLDATEEVEPVARAASEAKPATRYPFTVTVQTACEAVTKIQVFAVSAAEAESLVLAQLRGPDCVKPHRLPGTTFEGYGLSVITRVEPGSPRAVTGDKA